MRFVAFVKATKQSEAGAMPNEQLLSAMGKFNDELQRAGMLLDLGGLAPSSGASKIQFRPGEKPAVVDGPFAEAKELVAGYWVLQAKSKQEALEWLKRAPMLAGNAGEFAEIELRQIFGPEDFAPGPGVELAKQLGQKLGIK